MIRRPTRLLLACLTIVVAGCATAAPRQASPLAGVEWRLTQLEGAPVSAAAEGRAPHLRLVAEGTRVAGFTTCNNFFGSYTASGDQRLRFAELGSTKMACVDPALARQEQRFMAVLERVDAFNIVGDTLTLLEGTRPLARFVAAQHGG
jgi:heat shock protein HslJ